MKYFAVIAAACLASGTAFGGTPGKIFTPGSNSISTSSASVLATPQMSAPAFSPAFTEDSSNGHGNGHGNCNGHSNCSSDSLVGLVVADVDVIVKNVHVHVPVHIH